LILRSPSDTILDVDSKEGKESIFLNTLNILQYAVLRDAEKVVRYILQEHKVMTGAKQSRNVDQRIIQLGHDLKREDEIFTIRLASSKKNASQFFNLFWNTFPSIWNEHHFLSLL
jgi:hypothetical protein